MRQLIEIIRIDRAEVPDHPPTLQAARIAMLRMSFAVEVVEQIWIDLSKPVRIGPITVAPAISCINLTEMLAEWRAGTIRIFAGPVKRENGYCA